MFERFAHETRQAVTLAVEEAGNRGDRKVSTEHLLIGVLHDPTAAREVGAGPDRARRAVDRLDRDALTAVGIRSEDYGPLGPGTKAGHLPLTPGAKNVLVRTLALAKQEKARRIETKHLLNALRERTAPDPAAAVLAALREEPEDPGDPVPA